MELCLSCLWSDQCGRLYQCSCDGTCGESCSFKCNFYSPIDEGPSFTYYDTVLAENVEEYRLVSAEYGDGRWEDVHG